MNRSRHGTGGNAVNCKFQRVQRYICSNPHCRWEMEVRAAPGSDTVMNPHCVCGAAMKKPYRRPTLYRLTPEEAKKRFGKTGFG